MLAYARETRSKQSQKGGQNNMKFKQLLTVLLVLTICFSLCLVAVACNENDTDEQGSDTTTDTKVEDTKEEESLLITNGRFEKYSDGTAPYAPTGWSGSTSDSTIDSVVGVIPMKPTDYNAAMSNWNNLANPGNVPKDEDNPVADEDNHVLLIYNTAANVYTYKPNTQLVTTIGAYYQYSVQLMVKAGEVGITEGSGAYVTFSGAAYHQFGPFAETDEWQTVTFYIAASQVSAQTVNIAISLGDSGNPSSGYLFVDNVVAKKITAAQYAEAVLTDTAHTAAYSMLVPDGNFINSTDTTVVQEPTTWSGQSGKGNGANTTATYVRKGIVSTTEDGWAGWVDAASLTEENVKTPYDVIPDKANLSSDGKILAISNDFALAAGGASLLEECYTSYGYTNTMKMLIAPNTAYKLSVWVYTDLNTAEEVKAAMVAREATDAESTVDHSKFGANIIFTGYGDFIFDDIDTGKQWKEYSFYIYGSNTRYKNVNLELWLGKGGKDDTTRASGTVYFDNITLTRYEEYTTRDAALTAFQTYVDNSVGTAKIVDIQDNTAELITNGNFAESNEITVTDAEKDIRTTTGWTMQPINEVRDTATDVKTAIIDTVANADKNDAWWKENYDLETNPKEPHEFSPVLMINNVNPSAFQVRTTGNVKIKANLFYRVAVWVKTLDIKDGSGITVALMNADGDSSLSSFSTVNTASYENDTTGVNGYEQLEFYIKGSNLVTEDSTVADDKEVYILISFGSGNNFSTSSFVSGKVLIANVNMQQIDSSEYSDNSSNTTYSKSYSFAATSGSTSGSLADSKFDVITYDDEKVNEDGTQKALYKPSSWSTPSVTNVTSGILNVTQTAYVNELKTLTQYDFGDVYNAWAASVDASIQRDFPVSFGAPNVFMSYTKKDEAVKAAKILYNTSSISLSSNKYYVIRCYVRAVGTRGQLEFTTTGNKEATVVDFGITTAEDGSVSITPVADSAWEEICFVIKTGSFGSVTATVNLYLGNYSVDKDIVENDDENIHKPTYQGVIFADSFTCYAIDEDQFNTYVSTGVNNANLSTETFESTKTDTTDTIKPSDNLWSGSGSSDHTKVVGIYSRNYTTTKLEYLQPETTKDDDGNDVTTNKAVEEKTLTVADIFDTTGLTEGADLGNGVLVINNQTAGYYSFKSASITLAAGKAYSITVDARTFNIAEGEFAYIRLSVGDDNFDLAFNSEHVYAVDDKGNYTLADGANTYVAKDSAWQRFTFYVQNSKTSSVTANFCLMLGMSALDADAEESKPVQGTVLFDNVTLTEITAEAFNTQFAKVYVLDDEYAVTKDEAGKEIVAEGADAYQLTNKAIRISDDYTSEPEDNDGDDKDGEEEPKTDSSLLWLYITSIVIAGILIIVIVVWLIRRFMPKKLFKRKKSIDYDRNNATDAADKGKKSTEEAKSDDEFND